MEKMEGKYFFGSAKVGSKGQIVIPAEAREIFGIKPGDNLIILGDIEQGLAIPTNKKVISLFESELKEDE